MVGSTALATTTTTIFAGCMNHNVPRGLFLPNHCCCFGVFDSRHIFSALTFYKPKPFFMNVTATASDSQVMADDEQEQPSVVLGVGEIKEMCSRWWWRGHAINYLQYNKKKGGGEGNYPPVLLVHGFGASVAHWRRNIVTLAQNHMVYAIDLLGFGASDKPKSFIYTTEIWAQLILDFLGEVIQRPTVLIGNSVGSLACVIATDLKHSQIPGLVLLNCAGGMNNKAIVDDWRIKLLLPIFWFVDFLFKRRKIASAIFDRVKQRGSVRNILLSVYGNKESVDEDLVEIITGPADHEGALDAFVSIVTGPPGPNPVQLMPRITLPVLVLWGDEDPFTPLDGPVGKYFSSLPGTQPNVDFFVLKGVGHCPHDDRPELVHEKLLPWLSHLLAS